MDLLDLLGQLDVATLPLAGFLLGAAPAVVGPGLMRSQQVILRRAVAWSGRDR